MTLIAALRSSVERNPRKTVLSCGDSKITYEELDHISSSLGSWLLRQGLNPGDRVAIHWPNTIETVQLLFAAFKAGLIAVPINLRLKTAEVEYILKHSGAVLCFSHPGFVAVAEPAANACGCPIRTALPDDLSQDAALPQVDNELPAVILYTSGTTARPKGVIHTHKSLLATAHISVRALDYKQDESVLTVLPLMHAAALTCAMVPAILARG